jgi:hypothetical protein
VRLSELKDVLFPVEEHPIFVGLKDDSGERRLRVPDRKAIINGVTFKVLGVVGREYRLVTNQQALEWAYECCRSVFPDTTAAEWEVNATDGPATGGYCRIDLVHRTARLDFGDVRPGQRPDAFGPFIRVTNSYNALRALAFDIGFYRKVCRNGLIVPETIVRFKFPHQRRHLAAGIRFEVARVRLATLQAELSEQVAALKNCRVPRIAFPALVRGALMLRPLRAPRPTTRDVEEWMSLEAYIEQLCNRYAIELGESAYALLNVITDFASRPPSNRHVHRDPHGLRLAIRQQLPFVHVFSQGKVCLVVADAPRVSRLEEQIDHSVRQRLGIGDRKRNFLGVLSCFRRLPEVRLGDALDGLNSLVENGPKLRLVNRQPHREPAEILRADPSMAHRMLEQAMDQSTPRHAGVGAMGRRAGRHHLRRVVRSRLCGARHARDMDGIGRRGGNGIPHGASFVMPPACQGYGSTTCGTQL